MNNYHLFFFSTALLFSPLIHAYGADNLEDQFDFSDADTGFDFGDVEDTKKVAQWEEKGQALNLNVLIAAEWNFAYQMSAGHRRWVNLPIVPDTNWVIDWHSKVGTLYSEGNFLTNIAYTIEDDSQEVIDKYEKELFLRELYWKKSFDDYSFSTGVIKVMWGKADLLPVVDLISPSDQTKAIFARPEAARLGQNVQKFDLYWKQHQLNLLFIPYPRYNRLPEKGHPYHVFGGLDLYPSQEDDDREPEWAMRWNYASGPTDAAAFIGHVHNRDPLVFTKGDTTPWLEKHFTRFHFVGLSANFAKEPFVFKMEAAYSQTRPLQKFDIVMTPEMETQLIPSGFRTTDTLAVVIGLDYVSGLWGNITFELANHQNIDEYQDVLLQDNTNAAIHWSKNFLNDSLLTNLLFTTFSEMDNHIVSLHIKYRIDDEWANGLKITWLDTDDNNPLLANMQYMDRVDLTIEYTFSLFDQ
jgi:hypothetical protein